MGARSRRKGAAFERRIARWLSRLLGIDVFRQTDEAQRGNMGDHRVDVVHPLAGHIRLVSQDKHQKQPSPWQAIKEAEEATRGDRDLPVAMIRRHGGEDIVVLRPEGFARLLAGRRLGW